MLRRRALLPVLALALCAAALLPAAAAVGAKPHKTQVIVSLKFPAFHGSLKSGDDSCLRGRRVKMFRKRGGKTVKLGADTSAAKGKWAIPVGKKLTSGEYFATVAPKGDCRGGRSKTLTID